MREQAATATTTADRDQLGRREEAEGAAILFGPVEQRVWLRVHVPKSTVTLPRDSSSASKNSRCVEVEHAGEDHARELLDLRVVAQHAVVVELPRVGDAVLGRGELLLQVQEVLVGLEVGVGLGHREQAASARRSGRSRPGPARPAPCALIARCGPGDRFERAPLVRGVALDRLDQVGDEVVAALELHVDLRPGVVDLVPEPDQAVVRPQERSRHTRSRR